MVMCRVELSLRLFSSSFVIFLLVAVLLPVLPYYLVNKDNDKYDCMLDVFRGNRSLQLR